MNLLEKIWVVLCPALIILGLGVMLYIIQTYIWFDIIAIAIAIISFMIIFIKQLKEVIK